MKKRSLAWLVTIVLVIVAIAIGQFKAPVQQSDSFYVTDEANLFSGSEESAILSACQDLLTNSGARMVIVTVDHTGLQGMESFTEDLWGDWKLSGIDLLLVMKDDDYYFLYGSELSYVMDAHYRTLLDRYLEPEFAVRDYGSAVLSFISATGTAIQGGDDWDDWDDGYYASDSVGGIALGVLIFVVIVALCLVFSYVRPAGKRQYYGGYAAPRPANRPIIIHTTSHRPVSRPASRPGSFGGGRSSFGGRGGGFGGGGGRGGGFRGGGGRR